MVSAKQPKFTPEAEEVWSKIGPEGQEALAGSTWCGQCMGATRIVVSEGEMEDNLLLLHGTCAKCGKQITRAVEPPAD